MKTYILLLILFAITNVQHFVNSSEDETFYSQMESLLDSIKTSNEKMQEILNLKDEEPTNNEDLIKYLISKSRNRLKEDISNPKDIRLITLQSELTKFEKNLSKDVSDKDIKNAREIFDNISKIIFKQMILYQP